MNKTLLCLVAWLGCQTALRAQFYIDPGAQVAFEGTTLVTLRNIDFENNGALTTGTSTLYCTGKINQVITSGGTALYNLHFDKPSDRKVALGDDMRVAHEVAWVIPGTRLVLGKFNLYLEPDAFLTGYGSDAYVVTDNTGYLVKEDMDNSGFYFPVSGGDGAYNPIRAFEAGAPDHIGIRCLPEALEAGYAGPPIQQDAVAAAWDVVEAVPGKSKLSLMVQWTATDELPGFDRNNCGLAQYDPVNGWVLNAAYLAPAGSNDPFTRTHGPLAPGLYMIADDGFAQFSDHLPIAMRNAAPDDSDNAPGAFRLYPNPSSGALFLETGPLPAGSENIAVTVFDPQGRRILKQPMEVDARQVYWLDALLPDLPAGLYLIQVESPQGAPFRYSFIRL